MRVRALPALAILPLAACTANGDAQDYAEDAAAYATPGHSFIVDGGFGAESATLTLNGTEYRMEGTERNVFTVRTDPVEGGGGIEIVYNGDGATAYCTVGYVTGGDPEPHRYIVERLECREQ